MRHPRHGRTRHANARNAGAAVLALGLFFGACSSSEPATTGGGAPAPAASADAAVPAQIPGFEVQKIPADQVPPVPEIGGEAAQEAAFAIVLGQSQDVYRVVAFRTGQDPASVSEEDRLAVVRQEGADVEAASGTDVTLQGVDVRCYDTDDFGDVAEPDRVCVYVDGVALVYVVTHDQGSGGGEEFTRRVLEQRAGS